jgi:hypothetical protein
LYAVARILDEAQIDDLLGNQVDMVLALLDDVSDDAQALWALSPLAQD